jgi:hypothetical protein
MKESLRRIATSTLVIGLLALSAVTLTQLVTYCGGGQSGCMLAAVSFGVPDYQVVPLAFETAQSVTTKSVSAELGVFEVFASVVQAMSVYLILLSVVVLVVLEAFELRYLRQLLGRKHA